MKPISRACILSATALLLTFIINSDAFADQWILDLAPTQVITGPTAGGGQYIQLLVETPVANPAGCSQFDSYISEWQPSSTLATLLSALTAGKLVRIFISSTACDPATLRPSFTVVGVEG